jgi:hypothetical protein
MKYDVLFAVFAPSVAAVFRETPDEAASALPSVTCGKALFHGGQTHAWHTGRMVHM